MKSLTQGSIVGHISACSAIFAGMIMMMLCGLDLICILFRSGERRDCRRRCCGQCRLPVNGPDASAERGHGGADLACGWGKDRADANLVFNQSLGLSAVGGILTLIAGCMLARGYMRSVAVDDAVIEAGATYLVWFMPALALQFAML